MKTIILPIDPKDIPTAQQKGVCFRGGKPRFYEKSKVRDARQLLQIYFEELVQERIVHDAYELHVTYVYKLDKTPKRLLGKAKTTRPDLDNLDKLLRDAITDSKVAWKDDNQVTFASSKKRHAKKDEEAHIEVGIGADDD